MVIMKVKCDSQGKSWAFSYWWLCFSVLWFSPSSSAVQENRSPFFCPFCIPLALLAFPTQLLTSLGVRLCSERLSALSDCFVVYFDLGQKAWNSGWGPQEGPGASPLLLAALLDVKGLSSWRFAPFHGCQGESTLSPMGDHTAPTCRSLASVHPTCALCCSWGRSVSSHGRILESWCSFPFIIQGDLRPDELGEVRVHVML